MQHQWKGDVSDTMLSLLHTYGLWASFTGAFLLLLTLGLRGGSCRVPPSVRATDVATTTTALDLRTQIAELAARHECLMAKADHIPARSLTMWPNEQKRCVVASPRNHEEEDHHEDVF